MSLISVNKLRKSFKVPIRQPGFAGAIRGLFTHDFNEKVAVDEITFTIEKGELVGYIGPNGAGKSTSIKMLTGILVPTSGEIRVNGLSPHEQRREHVRNIGAVFGQKTQLWWDVPVIESLRLLKEIYKIPDATYRRNLDHFRTLLELSDFENTPVRQLSLGQRMRSDLAAALLHDPAILFLDEPTIGVDVVAKERFRGFIQEINRERGVTVLLTTHDMGDIEKLCSRMMVVDKGLLIYDGPLSQVRDEFAPYRVLVADLSEDMTEAELSMEGVEVIERKPRQIRFRFDRHRVSAPTVIASVAEKFPLLDISIEEPEIEAIVREIYQRR